MADTKKPTQQAKPYINSQETLKSSSQGAAIAREIQAEKQSFDQKFAEKQSESKQANPEFTKVFDLTSHRETYDRQEKISEIQNLLTEIRREVQSIKSQSAGLTAEVEQVERAAMQSLPDRVGIYHVRYFELVLEYLKNIKAKVGEARIWLSAMNSKKAKRGSAFSARSKKKGSEYSQSQELQLARSVG